MATGLAVSCLRTSQRCSHKVVSITLLQKEVLKDTQRGLKYSLVSRRDIAKLYTSLFGP